MIYLNNREKLDKIKKANNYYVITDFDRTLTTKSSEPSMGIVPNYLGGECLIERTKIFEHYRPIELDYTLDKNVKASYMKEWARESFKILSKYVTEDIVKKSITDANLHLRDGTREFLKELSNKKIPVIVMSSGIGNIVEEFLKKEDCLFSNMKVISNFFEFETGKPKINFDKLIATTTKEYIKIPEEIRKSLEKIDTTILFGDLIEDIKMMNVENIENTLTFGFLDTNIKNNIEEFNKNFDVVLTENENFNTVKNLLN